MTDCYLLNPFFLDEPQPELETLAEPGWEVSRPVLPESATQVRMSAVHRPLAYRVAEAVGRGERPIVIAGDCCATIAVHGGLQRAGLEPVLVWLDAHGDFNTWETTPSGFLGGMPLAMLVGLGDQTLMQAVSRRALPEQRVVLTDARDLDPGERELLERSDVRHLEDASWLPTADLPQGPLWVHFDVDVVDPSDVPAVDFPAPGGRSAAELEEIFDKLAARRKIAAVSISTWRPQRDPDGQSREICLRLLHTLIEDRH